ncbi:MAG: leucyl/phenylalanyl-tRNA--protein transferase [Isosphaeraceae bacterium]
MMDDDFFDDRPICFLGPGAAFPPPERTREDGLVAVGGEVTVDRLFEAYRQGIFPWYEPGGPILWWCPAERMVLEPNALKVSRSLRATLRKGIYRTTYDIAFRRVIRACGQIPRHGEVGSWITPEVEAGYSALHDLGYAHSVETWQRDELVGGLYGVLLGRCFFGESMFARRTDASKVAMVSLARALQRRGVGLIDCQVETEHLASLGATVISREEFLRRLRECLQSPDEPGRWTEEPGEP